MGTNELIIVWGAGSHAEVVSDIIELEAKYRVAGFLDDANPTRWGTSFCGATIIGRQAVLGEILSRRIRRLIVATVDHGCTVADGAHICPGAHLAGNVQVGRAAWVGIGSIVKEGAVIADGATIGASSVVIRAIPPGTLAFGVPARVVKEGSQS